MNPILRVVLEFVCFLLAVYVYDVIKYYVVNKWYDFTVSYQK